MPAPEPPADAHAAATTVIDRARALAASGVADAVVDLVVAEQFAYDSRTAFAIDRYGRVIVSVKHQGIGSRKVFTTADELVRGLAAETIRWMASWREPDGGHLGSED